MSDKFRSASNEPANTPSAGSLKEKLSGTSAPDSGVSGDLDIQDLLKKYLPEFAEEEVTEADPAEEISDAVVPSAIAEETLIVEDSEPEREEETARSGFFARLRASALKEEEEEPVIPDMSLYEEISAENGNDSHAEEELYQLQEEEMPIEEVSDSEEAEEAPAEMDETDLNLLMGLGLEDQIDKTVGEGTADMMAAQNDEDIRRLEEEKRRAAEYEYTERDQTPQIAQAYKVSFRFTKIKMIIGLFLTAILFFYENITLFGIQFAGALMNLQLCLCNYHNRATRFHNG